jgi:hypothetical protein
MTSPISSAPTSDAKTCRELTTYDRPLVILTEKGKAITALCEDSEVPPRD